MRAEVAARKCREIADRLWAARDGEKPSRDVLTLDSGDLHTAAGLLEEHGRVQGHCPMGCGETLFLGEGGCVTCSYVRCPKPDAVTTLLEDSETEHVARFDEMGFSLQHPLRERLDGELFDCKMHSELRAFDGAPVSPGTYRVVANHPHPPSFTRLD